MIQKTRIKPLNIYLKSFLIIFLKINTSCSITPEAQNIKPCHSSTKKGYDKIDKCIIKNTHSIKLSKYAIKTILWSYDDNLANIITKDNCYWANRSKNIVKKSFCFDNGSDYFKDGLTRFLDENNKFGFMDKSLKVIIPAKYKHARPFQNGNAEVCNNCVSTKDIKSEYSYIQGDWFLIDKTGKIVSYTIKKIIN